MHPVVGAVKKKTIDEAIVCLYFLPVFSNLATPAAPGTPIEKKSVNPIEKASVDPVAKAVEQMVASPVRNVSEKERRSRMLRADNLSTPSIAGLLGDKPANEDDSTLSQYKTGEHLRHESFNIDQLTNAWKEFASMVDAAQLKSALSVREPFLVNETTVAYDLDNEVQLQRITLDLKPKLLSHLHTALKNDKINLEFNVSENTTEIVNKPYTNQEKFNVLAAKYPVLGLFRQQFGLDFE